MGHLERGRAIAGLEGRYTIERKLSRGGTPTAFFARDEQGRALVVSELHATDLTDWSDVERVIAEARLHRDIVHPMVPPLVDLFATDGATARAPSELTEAFVRAAEDEGPTRPTALPSLIVVRAFVEGESVGDAIARHRPFRHAVIERMLLSLLGVVEALHALAPPCVRLVGEPGAVIVDPNGDAHVIRFASPPTRTAASPNLAPEASTDTTTTLADDLQAVGEIVLSAACHHTPGMWPRDTTTGAIAIAAIAPHVPERLRNALAGLAQRCFGSVASVRAALDGKAVAPSRAFRDRNHTIMVGSAIAASLLFHFGVVALAYRIAHHKPHFPQYQQTRARTPLSLPPPAPASPPAPVAATALPVPPRPRIEWTGELVRATPTLAPGTACVMALEMPQAGADSCSVTLACGPELLLTDYRARCALRETQTDNGFLYTARIGDATANRMIADGRDVTVLPVNTSQDPIRLRLSPKSLPSTYSAGYAIGTTHFAKAARYEGLVVDMTGKVPLERGAHCSFTIDPVEDDTSNCRASVRCGDATLYAGHATTCAVNASGPTGFNDNDTSPIDGDPSVSWEGPRLLHVADVTVNGATSVDIYLDRDKPAVESDDH